MNVLLLTVVVVIFVVKLIHSFAKGKRIYNKCTLNGPQGLPLLGNGIPLLRNYKAPMRQYTEWAKKFGGLFKIHIGAQPAVVVSDVPGLQKIFSKFGQHFHYRPRGTVLSLVLRNKGLVTSDGPVWQQHRRFTVRGLQEVGAGKQVNHDRMHLALEKLIKKVANGLHYPGFDPVSEVGQCMFETMWNYIGSENVAGIQMEQVKKFFEESPPEMQVAEMGGVWNFSIPLQLFWIFRNNPVKLLISTIRKSIFIRKEIANEMRRRKLPAARAASQVPKRLLNLYLDELDDPSRAKFPAFDQSQLRTYLADLLAAGVDTTFTSLRWILLLLAKYPHIAQKVQAELDAALEKKSLFELTNYATRYELPYLEAVILEALRFRPTIHTMVHATREDVLFDLDGKSVCIPKDCWVIGNIWGVHFDERLWEKPEDFNPDRFLDSNDRLKRGEADKCIPFSIGIRSCVGEQLARVSLYAFTVGLLSQFSFELEDAAASMEPIVGVSLIPPKTKLTFIYRHGVGIS